MDGADAVATAEAVEAAIVMPDIEVAAVTSEAPVIERASSSSIVALSV